ncbi:hypothetical protein FOC1_g10003043 [Fusarium oxysporum f. sp. cubense race 1]|uniref:Carbohydrate kinase PfkB domain-containing protein n=1 Tax=Fusarium oxysporum f. sp. cubense (strain race 1) TaxID=1229664 RepID=N4UXA3_FUSC1|nr:hypothetical protein FOC1_g10003043 [Fusarium oxysporum f. sp. cubense race 1]
MVEDHTREKRCLFTPDARATWRKAYFINAKQLGGGTQPDMVVSQMGIGKDVIETVLATDGKAAALTSGSDREDVNTKAWLNIADEFLSLGVSNVVITLVENSAFYANAEGNGHCPAFDVKVEDTTGAGLGAQEIIPWSEDIGSFDAPLKGLDFQWSKAPRGPGGGA